MSVISSTSSELAQDQESLFIPETDTTLRSYTSSERTTKKAAKSRTGIADSEAEEQSSSSESDHALSATSASKSAKKPATNQSKKRKISDVDSDGDDTLDEEWQEDSDHSVPAKSGNKRPPVKRPRGPNKCQERFRKEQEALTATQKALARLVDRQAPVSTRDKKLHVAIASFCNIFRCPEGANDDLLDYKRIFEYPTISRPDKDLPYDSPGNWIRKSYDTPVDSFDIKSLERLNKWRRSQLSAARIPRPKSLSYNQRKVFMAAAIAKRDAGLPGPGLETVTDWIEGDGDVSDDHDASDSDETEVEEDVN